MSRPLEPFLSLFFAHCTRLLCELFSLSCSGSFLVWHSPHDPWASLPRGVIDSILSNTLSHPDFSSIPGVYWWLWVLAGGPPGATGVLDSFSILLQIILMVSTYVPDFSLWGSQDESFYVCNRVGVCVFYTHIHTFTHIRSDGGKMRCFSFFSSLPFFSFPFLLLCGVGVGF